MQQKSILKDNGKANEQIIKILLDQDELTWKDIIYELVKTEQMDPWDIDVSKLAVKFLEMIHTLQDMDFRITGKIVLAAALLLKIKSNRFLEEDLTALDSLITGGEDYIDLLEELPLTYEMEEAEEQEETPNLIPRTPQPRKRRVAVDDLVNALEKALKVELRRSVREELPEMEVNLEEIDISKVIKDVYEKVFSHYKKNKDETLTFSKLVPKDATKDDKVFTFIPLLHLDHQQTIDMKQESSFDEIFIDFLKELDENFQVDTGDLGAVKE